MDYDFESYLFGKLSRVAIELGFKDVKIVISEGQNFAKMDKLTPETIYVVIKYLSSDIQFFAESMPIQILVMSEQNSLDKAQMILNKFTTENNWVVIPAGTTYVKQQYNSPVVLNNYVEVSYGYRSVLYVTGMLYVLKGVMDVTDLTATIGENSPVDIQAISSTIGYTMAGDTQPFSSGYAKTEKSFATFVMTINVPCVTNGFTDTCMGIMNGTVDGNTSFVFNFNVGSFSFTDFSMKLVGATITTAVNNVPSLQLSFSV